MAFNPGDKVEVCSKADGFLGSYYTASVVSQINTSTSCYVVRYMNLVEEHDESTPLKETVSADEVRPMPPKLPLVSAFDNQDKVDAFDNDGWWVGRIVGQKQKGSNIYTVYFDSTGDEIDYHVSRLRFHQDWINGKWIIASRNNSFDPELCFYHY